MKNIKKMNISSFKQVVVPKKGVILLLTLVCLGLMIYSLVASRNLSSEFKIFIVYEIIFVLFVWITSLEITDYWFDGSSK